MVEYIIYLCDIFVCKGFDFLSFDLRNWFYSNPIKMVRLR